MSINGSLFTHLNLPNVPQVKSLFNTSCITCPGIARLADSCKLSETKISAYATASTYMV